MKAAPQGVLRQEPPEKECPPEEMPFEEAEVPDGFVSGEGDDARTAPPPRREFAFMEFLMSHEHDAEIDSVIAELLPECVFSSDFTVRFVGVWRGEIAGGGDMFADFAGALGDAEKGWFDGILLNAGKVEASSLAAKDILRDFVRLLWVDHLKRQRDALPFAGDAGDDIRRMTLSMNIKRLMHMDWEEVKCLVLDLKDS